MPNIVSSSSSVTNNRIDATLFPSLERQEKELLDSLSAISTDSDGNVSQAELLRMQQLLQQWTLMTEIMSTVVKEAGDSLKSIVQKAS